MTFYEKLRNFFLKNDPGRVRLAKRIAARFTSKGAQNAVMNRLKEVYANGGPDNLTIAPKAEKIEVIEEVADVVAETEEVIEATEETEEGNVAEGEA